MAIYNHKECVLVLNGYEITEFTGDSDCINMTFSEDAGEYTIGSSGKGVFVTKGNDSGTLAMKLLQHSADNQYLNNLFNQQRNNIRTFVPIELYFKDTLNGDIVTGSKGYFTAKIGVSRGDAHNPYTWTIQFESLKVNLEKGLHN